MAVRFHHCKREEALLAVYYLAFLLPIEENTQNNAENW